MRDGVERTILEVGERDVDEAGANETWAVDGNFEANKSAEST
jgi:hypothetical protein